MAPGEGRLGLTRYLLSLPERVVRSTLGLSAGVAREVGDVALPKALRRTRLYQHLVDGTLRFGIEQVGGAKGVYNTEGALPDQFLARRAAGNVVEALGVIAFRASPVWVLAGLADLCGAGRELIPEIADALKAEGLLEPQTTFTTVDQLLDGLERTSSRLAGTINTPPLDVAGLREEWQSLREEARFATAARLPSREAVTAAWTQVINAARQQDRSVFETSSALALSALRGVPDQARWVSASARVGATRTGAVIGGALLQHYQETLQEIQQVGYATYTTRQLRPYVAAALEQFSPQQSTLTERVLERWRGPGAALLIAAATAAAASAQAPQESAILERPLVQGGSADGAGWTPEAPPLEFALAIARAARVPMVFESAGRGPRPAVPLRVHGTVGMALQSLASVDQRYQWEVREGVLVIRPRVEWGNRGNPLNREAGPIAWDGITARQALGLVTRLINRQPEGGPPGAETRLDTGDARVFTVDAPRSATVLDVMVAAARAHGELIWSVPWDEDDPLLELGGWSIGFRTFDPRAGGGSYTPK